MAISELARAQNLASLEHQPHPVRQRLRAVGKEEPRYSKQVGVAEQANERFVLLYEQSCGAGGEQSRLGKAIDHRCAMLQLDGEPLADVNPICGIWIVRG